MSQNFKEIADELAPEAKKQIFEDYLYFERNGSFPKPSCLLMDILEEMQEDNPDEEIDFDFGFKEIVFYVCLSFAKNWMEVEKIYTKSFLVNEYNNNHEHNKPYFDLKTYEDDV